MNQVFSSTLLACTLALAANARAADTLQADLALSFDGVEIAQPSITFRQGELADVRLQRPDGSSVRVAMIGNRDDAGTVRLQTLIFTSREPLMSTSGEPRQTPQQWQLIGEPLVVVEPGKPFSVEASDPATQTGYRLAGTIDYPARPSK